MKTVKVIRNKTRCIKLCCTFILILYTYIRVHGMQSIYVFYRITDDRRKMSLSGIPEDVGDLVGTASPFNDTTSSATEDGGAGGGGSRDLPVWMTASIVLEGFLSAVGMIGNALVVVVVLRSAAMRSSVTNSYIVNLAVSDFCFLAGLPLLMVTVIERVSFYFI